MKNTSTKTYASSFLLFLLISFNFIPIYAIDTNFSLNPNGITIECEKALIGETGEVNGLEYTKIGCELPHPKG